MPYANLLNRASTLKIGGRSFTGTAVKVADDFIILHDHTVGHVILPFEHVKQIAMGTAHPVGESGTPSLASLTPEDLAQLPDQFLLTLQTLQRRVVQLEGGGPNPTVGYLMEVNRDYLTMCVVPEGLVYFHIPHVQAVLPLDVIIRPEFIAWAEQQAEQLDKADSFHQVLQSHAGKMVTFGRNGREVLSGIIADVTADYVEVVTSPCGCVWLPIRHVKTVTTFVQSEWQSMQKEEPQGSVPFS